MAGSVNKVIIVGNLGADPEVRQFPNGGQVCNMKIATTEKWTNRDGERQEKTEWHSIAMFGDGLIRVAQDYLRKGDKVYIEGQLQTRKYTDREGNERYNTEIVVRGIHGAMVMLGSPNQSRRGGDYHGDPGYDRKAPAQSSRQQPEQDFSQDMDDEIPF